METLVTTEQLQSRDKNLATHAEPQEVRSSTF